jgi:hypothetical protein
MRAARLQEALERLTAAIMEARYKTGGKCGCTKYRRESFGLYYTALLR